MRRPLIFSRAQPRAQGAMLSQFFILSSRGDAIVARDFRHDVSRSSHEVLFRSLKLGTGDDGEVAPVFFQDGVNYFHVKASWTAACRPPPLTPLPRLAASSSAPPRAKTCHPRSSLSCCTE